MLIPTLKDDGLDQSDPTTHQKLMFRFYQRSFFKDHFSKIIFKDHFQRSLPSASFSLHRNETSIVHCTRHYSSAI